MKSDLEFKHENIELEEDQFSYTKTGTYQNLNTEQLMTTYPDTIPTEKTSKDAPIVMTLDIESGKTDQILIFFDSNPDKLAYDFCKKHNLNFESLEYLKAEIQNQIKENIQKVEECKRQASEINENSNLISDRQKNNLNTHEKEINLTENSELSSIRKNKEKINNNVMFSYEIFLKNKNAEEKKDNSIIKKSNSSIFNRLYTMNNKNPKNEILVNDNGNNEIQKKKRTKSSNRNDSISLGINTGERMYQRAMKLKEETMRKIQKVKENEMKTLNENCTFSPKLISTPSGLSNLKKQRILTDAYSLNSLNKYIVEREEKMNELKDKYSEMNLCSFSPKINNRSNRMIGEKYHVFNTDSNNDYRNDKNTELFEYSKVRNLKLKTMESEFYSQFTHKPSINNNIQISSNFIERQENMIKKQLEYQGKIKEDQERNIDPETGQKYFIPKVNNSGSFSRNLNKNVYHHLYENGKKMRQEKEKKSCDFQKEILNNSTRVFTIHLTETIFNNVKKNSYKKLFEIAKDCYPFIKNTMKLTPDVYKILNPLFMKVKEGFHKYREETFINECDSLFQKLNINQKSLLINFVKNYDPTGRKKEKIFDTNLTFHPKINTKKSSSKYSNSRVTYCFEKQSSKGSTDLFSY